MTPGNGAIHVLRGNYFQLRIPSPRILLTKHDGRKRIFLYECIWTMFSLWPFSRIYFKEMGYSPTTDKRFWKIVVVERFR